MVQRKIKKEILAKFLPASEMEPPTKRTKKASSKAIAAAESEQNDSLLGESEVEAQEVAETAEKLKKKSKAPSAFQRRNDNHVFEGGEPNISNNFSIHLCNDCWCQVLLQTPFLVKHGQGDESWNKVTTALNSLPQFTAQLTVKKARDKYNDLTKAFKASQSEKAGRTGADDEPVSEMDILLQDIVDLKDDDNSKKKSEKAGGQQKEQELQAAPTESDGRNESKTNQGSQASQC
jgi:hypothetical protein